ncbi:hypothetical protein HYT23_04565 [Candidatus Pacearchaeota archaeon]|nr:hypothetical protein [Candidatus Pacearchaeota archaeon]
MAKDKGYYEARMKFLVDSLVDGTISRDDLRRNSDSIMIMMRNYCDEHSTGNSPLSFTILQDQIFEN